MRPRDHYLFVNIGSLLLCGLLAGVVVAAVFFPGVALSGLAAKESLARFDQLPSELIVDDAPEITYVYASDGKTPLTAMYDENRRSVELHEIAPIMVKAMIAAEDKNFYEHNGVDIRGIARAFIANTAADQITQGASTITQQFVRLSLTYFADDLQDVVDATEETTGRKLREARYAIAVEQRMTKDEILNKYLNLAYFGEGAYGIFAASRVYFDKQPSDLELHEAAYLAGLVRSPSAFNPRTPEGRLAATERRSWVLDQMVDTEAITPAQAAEARAVPMDIDPQRPANMCVGVATNHWGFFCDYLHRWWLEQEEFGATVWEREQRLRGGGFRIVTTLDVDTQQAAKDHVEDHIDTGDPHALMLAAVEPGTGEVRAMATNRRFKLDDPDDPQNGPHTDPAARRAGLRGTYPNSTNPLISGGGDITGYQAGSVFKIFTMIAALEQGLPLSYSIFAPFQVTTDFIVEAGGAASCGNRWCPVNFSRDITGRHDMWSGFGRSVNTYFAQLIERVGAANAVDVAKRLGIQFRARGTPQNPSDFELSQNPEGWGAFTLGVSDTTPLDLAGAFAAVSAEGVYCEPTPVKEIQTPEGESIDLARPDCTRAIDKDVARAAIDAARCVIDAPSAYGRCEGGTETWDDGTGQATRDVIDQPFFGKTGTTDGSRTASLVLSTSELTVAGMLADPDWAETREEMSHDIVNPAVLYTLRDAMEGVDAEDWAKPTAKRALGDQTGIPSVTCRPVSEAQDILEDAGFSVRVDETRVDSDCAAGLAAGTSPSGRTVEGGVVVIEVSNGSDHQEETPGPTTGPPTSRPEPPPGRDEGEQEDEGDEEE